jgi:hypothetical protein
MGRHGAASTSRLRLRSWRRCIPKSSGCQMTLSISPRAKRSIAPRERVMRRVLVSSTGSSTNANDIEPVSSPRISARSGFHPDDEAILRLRRHGEDVAGPDLLELRNDPFRAPDTAVIETVVAVPTSAPAPHLHEPGPDVSGASADRDGVIPSDLGVRNQLVTWQRPRRLVSPRTNRPPRYHRRDEDPEKSQRISDRCDHPTIAPILVGLPNLQPGAMFVLLSFGP